MAACVAGAGAVAKIRFRYRGPVMMLRDYVVRRLLPRY